MPLLALPNEIVLLIAAQLDSESDILHFMITNRTLYYLLILELFKRNVEHTGGSALIKSVENCNEWAVRTLLSLKANPDIVAFDLEWNTPLTIAVTYGYTAIVQILLENGAKPGFVNNRGTRPLTRAIKYNQGTSIMKLLIDYGAYDDSPVHLELWSHSLHHHQDDPLVAAVISGDIHKLEMLRAHANLNLSDHNLGPSLLRCAVQFGSSSEMMKMLLDSGLDLSGKDGLDSLKHAARMSSLPMVRWLLDLGAPVNAPDARQRISPLHIAADPNYHTDVAIVKLLIDHGAQVNAMSFTGQTPLHCTARRCDVAIATVLLDNGADANIQNDYDKTALHIAAELNSADLIKLLLSCGATVPSKANGLPPIRLAADNPIALMLLAHDSNAHFRE